jgi:DNA helicase-2/ATP-dependent DNA helicase PcrA
LQGLNQEQRQAVEAIQGPLLVLAGAGSGKTRVITHRIAHMIENKIEGKKILAVTFTNKAATQMRERLHRMIGDQAKEVMLSTFHSLGLFMLREEGTKRNNKGRFAIYDAADQQACLRQLAASLNFDRSFDLSAITARISAWKNAFIIPDKVTKTDDPYDEAARVFYPKYEKALKGFAAVDFDDLICKPTLMMESDEACRKRWSERFAYVLVDEYQDTNAAQLRMIKAMVSDHQNLCAVGDDDQSIYGWRGAQVKNILRFERDFPGCRKIYLMRNYRSVGSVLDLANAVIAENEKRHPKSMIPHRGKGTTVQLHICEDGDEEAAWVARQILKKTQRRKYRPSQIAVLYRSNLLARSLEAELRAQNVGYRILGGKSFFDRKEVKDIMAYLRVCAYPADDISLRRIINFPARGIGSKTLTRLARWAEDNRRPLSAALPLAEKILPPGDRAVNMIWAFSDIIRQTRARLKNSAEMAETVRQLVVTIGLKEAIDKTSPSPKAFEKRMLGVTAFIQDLNNYVKKKPNPSLRDFLRRLALIEFESKSDEKAQELITLSTLHGSKGLEFSLVFLIGMEEGILPHDRVLNPQVTEAIGSDLAEERRLCYVGITRAKDELILTRAAQRQMHGKMRERAPSRFIANIPEALLQVNDQTEPLSESDARSRLADIRAALNSTCCGKKEGT